MTDPVDLRLAARRAARLAPPGPRGTPEELTALVAGLREAAASAPQHVGRLTGLHDAAHRVAGQRVSVVDRPGWARANADLLGHVSTGLLPPAGRLGARLAGEEAGALLAYLSTKVLGQFDPFGPGAPHLLLVAPNVLRLERELDLDARDFRRWVALHEQTHAVQFAAAPWLAEHLTGMIRGTIGPALTEDQDRDVGGMLAAVVAALRDRDEQTPAGLEIAGPLVDALLTPAERESLQRVVAVMSLLEGHADVVMDAVGPAVLPSVRRIRRQFDKRRDGTGPLDVLLRTLLGMRAKTAQYRNGAAFVRQVVERVGHDGLNAVWAAPDLLPTPTEILEPAAWVSRVHA
ncbi:zinc-dependent metalloprotease [Georgenia sp. Z1344]|uniref:zinc-dependent metalloprotease n=1 Tax=Georgenia sp. Z1344 TaxID=3416706 RepID=UPI003CEC70F7